MVLSKPVVNALSFYFSQLYEHPVRTKSISCCVIATAANYTSQRIAGNKILNYQSLLAYGIFGLFFGGSIPHYFYSMLERAIPEEASFVIAKKLILERLVYSPLFQAFTLYLIARLEGKDHQTALKQLQSVYWEVLTCSWKYLTVIQLLNLTVVPPVFTGHNTGETYTQCTLSAKLHLRVLIVNLVGFFWAIYLANKRRQLQAKSSKAK